MDFYSAWRFLEEHKIFNNQFNYYLWIEVVKVNPKTNSIDLNSSKNTQTQIWLEHGPFDAEWGGCTHDLDLDCGGATFEEAIINLAKLVKKHYNEDGTKIKSEEKTLSMGD